MNGLVLQHGAAATVGPRRSAQGQNDGRPQHTDGGGDLDRVAPQQLDLAFAAGTQGFYLTKSRAWETAAMLLIALILFRPGIVWDQVFPPLIEEPPAQLEKWVSDMDPGSSLRLTVKGEKMNGKEFTKTVMLTVGDQSTPEERLAGVGIETYEEDGKVLIDNVVFASAAEKAGLDFDQEILNIQIPIKRLT
jgi:hypothetical protein